MNLDTCVSLDCPVAFTIDQISYSLGILQLELDYTEDLEGLTCRLNVTFESSVVLSPEASI